MNLMDLAQRIAEQEVSRIGERVMAKHTPGPWMRTKAGPVMQGYSQPFAIGEHMKPNLIAGCFGDVRGGEEVAMANARLIAAAPDLLEALKEALALADRNVTPAGRTEECQALYDKCAGIIAKAESKD